VSRRTKVKLRNIDLNLLVPLKALLHERNVTRAAERFSKPPRSFFSIFLGMGLIL
jgi:hypothetical protein